MKKDKLCKEYKLWFIIATILVLLWFGIIVSIVRIQKDNETIYLETEMRAFQSKVESTLKTYEVFSNYIFEEVVNQEEVLSIFSKAKDSNLEEKKVLRDQLYNLLGTRYENITKYQFRQLHFHLPTTESFLRFHRPEKYGDRLADVRETVRLANINEQYVFGFEEGRIYNGYRFVYPLSYNEEHIGSVEVSVSIATLLDVLTTQYPEQELYFIMDEEVVRNKVFEDQQKNYITSESFSGYVYDVEVYDIAESKNNLISRKSLDGLLVKIRRNFNQRAPQNENFSIFESIDGQAYLLQFMSVRNIKDKPVGYLISLEKNEFLKRSSKDLVLQSSFTSLIFATFLLVTFMYIRYQVKIQELSLKDPLTGLYNRTKFNQVADDELLRCRRYNQTFALLMIDIDFFKKVNDVYGHLQGDEVLKKLARLLESQLRRTDLACRWGGEEFICFLPYADANEAEIVGEKIRKKVEETIFDEVGHITVSVGVTIATGEDEILDKPIARADNALYESKRSGRNRLTVQLN